MTNFQLDCQFTQLGFSDEKLEKLSSYLISERGFTPWATWESENTSFGKTFRKWAFYPSWLPIFISSDHAVHWESKCWPNETDSSFDVFFTWNKKKAKAMSQQYRKSAYHVPHPWVFFRKKHFKERLLSGRGTLIYFAHSNGQTIPFYENLDEYFDSLKALPDKYKPLCLCLSFHDIQKGLHKKLRQYGIPIVTAGNASSKSFVDRFYSLIYQFKYATSPNIGSHTFYALEAGVSFFIFGKHPQYISTGSKFIPDGAVDYQHYGDEEDIERLQYFKSLISKSEDFVSWEVKKIVEDYLGLDSKITRLNASFILWSALIFNMPKLIPLYFRGALKLIRLLTK